MDGMKRLFEIFDNRSFSDRKGQVAIFIALIFQLLFLFFAMVVNVGLLVHHKINLQNSVDLAAYYGAMKQSEVMNAIAHTNYQIRQSYKLLTWRYRVLGVAGVFPKGPGIDPQGGHPVTKNGNVNAGIRGGTITEDDSDTYPRSPETLKNFYERPAFCVAFRPFDEVPTEENTCRAPAGQTIAALRKPPIVASFIGAAHTAARVTDLANKSMRLRCEFMGPYNYVVLGRFIVAFNIDQGERKTLIYKLANGLSNTTDTFIDIEGEDAKDGIRKTLDNNLTAANKAAITSFKVFNSLASGPCAESPAAGSSAVPPGWLSEISIYPRASYKMCIYSGGSVNESVNIDVRPRDAGTGADEKDFAPVIDYLSQYIADGRVGSVYRPSLGVEKNPWCMAYVGVRAEAEPEIPFAFGKIKLKAVAFAKPFGGKIGPWYGKTWSPSTQESSGYGDAQRTDPRTPPRCPLGAVENCTAQGQDAVTTLNYSRFPGDPVGLASRTVHGQYGKSIFDLGNPSFDMWKDIESPADSRGGETDILAWSDRAADKKMRELEVASIVPDLFDLTYYSIDPDFFNNYYAGRLEKYLQKHPISGGYKVRHDLGSRASGTGLSGGRSSIMFNIKDQLDMAASVRGASNNAFGLDWGNKLMYALIGSDNFGQLLTGWISKPDLSSYEFDKDRFGNCTKDASKDAPVPGSCEKGGRTGYSVKLISSDYLLDTHRLGGSGSSSARILNPPDADFIK